MVDNRDGQQDVPQQDPLPEDPAVVVNPLERFRVGAAPVQPQHFQRTHPAFLRGSRRDYVVFVLLFCTLLSLSVLNDYTMEVAIWFVGSTAVVACLLGLFFLILRPLFYLVLRVWWSLLRRMLDEDGEAVRLMRLLSSPDEIMGKLIRPNLNPLADEEDVVDDVRISIIENRQTDESRNWRRRNYRRNTRDENIIQMVNHAKTEVGSRLDDKPENRMVLDKVMRDYLKDRFVRNSDIAKAMPLAVELYFVPTEEDIEANAMRRGWVFWIQKLRLRGWGWLFGRATPYEQPAQ